MMCFPPPYYHSSTMCSACAVHVPYSKTACHSFHSAMSSLALPQRVPGSLLINSPEKGSSVQQRQRERAKSRIRTNQIVLPHAFPPPVIVFFAAETTLFLLHQKKNRDEVFRVVVYSLLVFRGRFMRSYPRVEHIDLRRGKNLLLCLQAQHKLGNRGVLRH